MHMTVTQQLPAAAGKKHCDQLLADLLRIKTSRESITIFAEAKGVKELCVHCEKSSV